MVSMAPQCIGYAAIPVYTTVFQYRGNDKRVNKKTASTIVPGIEGMPSLACVE
jgi:hypothetical protein